MRFLFLLGMAVLCQSLLLAQNKQKDIEEAQFLLKKHPEESVVARMQKEFYQFVVGDNSFKQPVVKAKVALETDFISLVERTDFQHVEYYNSFLEIDRFEKFETLTASQGGFSTYSRNRFKRTAKSFATKSAVSDGIFFDDNRVAFQRISFSGVGDRAQTQVSKIYNDSKYLARIFFSESFAIENKEVSIEVPNWMQVDIQEVNFNGFNIQKSVEEKSDKRIIKYKILNLEPISTEPESPSIAYALPHLLFRVTEFKKDNNTIQGFKSIQDVYNWYYFLYQQCRNDVNSIKSLVAQITANHKTDEAKIKALYYWVQDNVRYIAYEDGYSGFIPATIQETVKNRYGDCKAMANLLTEMLKLAGYQARFTWIGTKQIPYGRVPNMCVDNHAITTLFLQGKTYYLDGTEFWVPFGQNAFRIQGKSALVENGQTFQELQVPVSLPEDHAIRTRAKLKLLGAKLNGTVQVTMSGNMRKDFHQVYQLLPRTEREDQLKAFLSFGSQNISASLGKTSDLSNREIDVQLEGAIDLEHYFTLIGDELFVGVDFFPRNLTRYEPALNRKSGYAFDDLILFDDQIEIEIPADRKFGYIPPPITIENEAASFKAAYTVAGNKIKYVKSFIIKKDMLPAAQLSTWRHFIGELKAYNRNLISVVKK